MRKILLFFIVSMSLFFLKSINVAYSAAPISGTFYMSDIVLSESELRTYVKEIKATGIDTLVILSSGELTKNNDGTYNEKIFFTDPAYNFSRDLLKIAYEENIKLFYGLASADFTKINYGIGTPNDINTDQGRLINFSLKLADQIKLATQNAGVPWNTVIGFYIPQEGWIFNSPTSTEFIYYKELSLRLKAKDPSKKILISPYHFEENTLTAAKIIYEAMYRDTGIDIIAPQDGFGGNKVRTFEKSSALFRELSLAAAQFPGKEAWANVESFYSPLDNWDYNPTTIERLSQQINGVTPYVTKIITWIYQHTMLSDPIFDSRSSWSNFTNQYTPERANMRRKLRFDYITKYDISNNETLYIDVPLSHWAYSSINIVTKNNVATGCNAYPPMFCPDNELTRANLAIMLLKSKYGGSYIPPTSSQKFTDVPPTYWAYNWINQLVAEGITGGCTATTYCPENPVTRAQIAVFLLKTKYGQSFTPPVATGIFSDVPTFHWAASWIEKLYKDGIVSGCGTNPLIYCPDQNITRAQSAVLLVKTFNLIVTPTPIATSTPLPKPGDLDFDSDVDMDDYNLLITNFGNPYSIYTYNQVIGNLFK